jgi:hypothetical protein
VQTITIESTDYYIARDGMATSLRTSIQTRTCERYSLTLVAFVLALASAYFIDGGGFTC